MSDVYWICRVSRIGPILSFETGTSGDTGSAAISAVKGLKWVDIVVLLPKGRCTEIQGEDGGIIAVVVAAIETIEVFTTCDIFLQLANVLKAHCNFQYAILLHPQERQMTTVISGNVHNFAVEGTSDELDVPIKTVFADWEYKKRHNLCSINSLNWARVLVQGQYSV